MKQQFKTFIILALLTALFLYVGQLVGGGAGFAIAIVLVVVMNGVSLFYSDKIVLKMYKAQPAPQDSRLYKSTKRLAHKAKLPMPKVYILPQAQPNAFATGRSPKHSAVAATQGLLDMMTDDELDGVVAHELAHIKNRDTLIQTVAAMIAGVISYVATMAQWAAIFGGFSRDGQQNNLVEMLVLIIVTPLVASILQLSLSRAREYIADATAAKITHKPRALASALRKLERGTKQIPMREAGNATASLFIANPFGALKGVGELFSTHPPIQKRIAKLEKM